MEGGEGGVMEQNEKTCGECGRDFEKCAWEEIDGRKKCIFCWYDIEPGSLIARNLFGPLGEYPLGMPEYGEMGSVQITSS